MYFLDQTTFLYKKRYIFDRKFLKKAKGVQEISKEFAYCSYFKDTPMGLLVWSDYKIFVGNNCNILFRHYNKNDACMMGLKSLLLATH